MITSHFYKYFRIAPERFDHLLSLLAPMLSKKPLDREPISPDERLAVPLPYRRYKLTILRCDWLQSLRKLRRSRRVQEARKSNFTAKCFNTFVAH